MAITAIPSDLYQLAPTPGDTDQRLTVDNTVGGVQFSAFGVRTTHVLYTVEDAECRFTLDGSAPTTTNGHVLGVGDSGIMARSWFSVVKFIRTGGTSSVIHASPLTIAGK